MEGTLGLTEQYVDGTGALLAGLWRLRMCIPFCYPLASKATSQPFIHGMHQLGATLTTTPSYQPQSNGMAERCVGLMKTAVRRLLMSANLVDRFWPYAVQFAAQQQ
eukprot:5809184-Amphidinium_carterae.2